MWIVCGPKLSSDEHALDARGLAPLKDFGVGDLSWHLTLQIDLRQ